jgi:uncharacterized phage-associated protein
VRPEVRVFVTADLYDVLVADVSAHDIAAEIRRRNPRVDDVCVHKLLYFAQGFHLASTGRPLFKERIEAWVNGPVVASLWHDEHKHRDMPAPVPLNDGQHSVVGYVLGRYGSRTASELIHLTHTDGGPWCQVTETDNSAPIGNEEIGVGLMREWFAKDDEVVRRRSDAEQTGRRWRELVSADTAPGLAVSLGRVMAGEHFSERRPKSD